MKKAYDSCVAHDVKFTFGQTGNVFIQDGKETKVRNRTEQMVLALRSGLNYPAVDAEKEIEEIYAQKAAILCWYSWCSDPSWTKIGFTIAEGKEVVAPIS